ncbi:helix-turn-helix domain-containing protein [Labedaea rhizosphaerae]|nr:helix-turn-helix domain-containing protein [Labedaea rhizosphaerae]
MTLARTTWERPGQGVTFQAPFRGPLLCRTSLGSSRKQRLASVGRHSTTSELARRLKMAPSSASEHIHVLRDAGLLTSRRLANSVIHSLTPLGHSMLTLTRL